MPNGDSVTVPIPPIMLPEEEPEPPREEDKTLNSYEQSLEDYFKAERERQYQAYYEARQQNQAAQSTSGTSDPFGVNYSGNGFLNTGSPNFP